MSMPSAFFLVKDDGAGLPGESEPVFDLVNGFEERFRRDVLPDGRIDAQAEHRLFALGAACYGLNLVQGPSKVVGAEVAELCDLNVIVFSLQKMFSKVLAATALGGYEDHCAFIPSAVIRIWRMLRMVSQASRKSSIRPGVTSIVPVLRCVAI